MAYTQRNGILINDSTRAQVVQLMGSDPTVAAGESHVGEVGQWSVNVLDTWARVADGNPYTIGDVIATTVSNTGTTPLRGLALARVVGRGLSLRFFSVAFTKTDFLPTIRAHFFTLAAPPTALVGDNVPFVQSIANIASRLGHVDLPAHVLAHAAGDDYTCASRDDLDMLLIPAAADTNIYYRLEIIAGTSITPSISMAVNVRARAVGF